MSVPWSKRYWAHFQKFFGKPFDWQDFQQDEYSLPLRLVTYDHALRKYKVIASVGLSEHSEELKARGEVVVLADVGWRKVPYLLANALFFAIRKEIPLTSKFTIGGVANLDPGFAEQYGKTGLYLTNATGFPPGFAELPSPDGETGQVFQGLFVSDAEQSLIRDYGGEEFERRLMEQKADPCSIQRPSLL
jgi:Suppressor of fused protein (SUFU)